VERKGYMLKSLALLIALGIVALALGGGVLPAVAQDNETSNVIIESDLEKVDGKQKDFVDGLFEDSQAGSEVNKTGQIMAKINRVWDRSIDRMPSLFFTYWQHQSIIDAKKSHGIVRPPTDAELKALEDGENLDFDPERRYVTLGGIVYKGDDDWTIWLNGERVTPSAVPKEVMDLQVYKDYIEVKWLDEYTNSIFPLRLRAHQRFNMDMRIFLPG